MTPGIKPLPNEAGSFTSVQNYQNTCDAFATKLKKGPIDWSEAVIANRTQGDKQYQFLYNDLKNDFYCSASVNWFHRSMEVKGGLLSEVKRGSKFVKDRRLNQTFQVNDACTMTNAVVGTDELGKEVCKDDSLDPRLEMLGEFHTGKLFLQRANELQQDAAILSTPTDISPKNMRIIDDVRGDGVYGLLYENPEENFFVEGIVDSLQHAIMIRKGRLDEYNTAEAEEVMDMTDACSMTEGLLGKGELVGECMDRTQQERDREFYISMGWQLATGIAGYYFGYKILKKIFTRTLPSGLPIYRHIATAYLAASAYDALAGLVLDQDNPVRRYGTLAAGATGLIWPEATMMAMKSVVPQAVRAGIATRMASIGSRSVWGSAARGAGRLANGALLVAGLDWAWGTWVTDSSSYQASVNKRVADQVYEDDDVYDLRWYDIFIVPAVIKGARAGSRWIAPNAMNSAITWDNEEIEDKIKAEDWKNCEAAEGFIKDFLPPLLSASSGVDAKATLALLQNGKIELTKAEEDASELLFQEGAGAVVTKFKLSPEKIEELAQKALLKKVQEAAAFLHFVDDKRNDWARDLFNKDGTMKASIASPEKYDAGAQPSDALLKRFPYTPEPKEYWVNLNTGEKIPAFEPVSIDTPLNLLENYLGHKVLDL